METLHRLCAAEGIVVEYVSLTRSKRILGWYYRAWDGQPIIALDVDLQTNPILGRCVLAEEYGHHKTGSTGCIIHAGAYSLTRANRARDESRAVRYAAELLIPTRELAEAIQKGCTSTHDLADHFYVMPWMVRRRLHFLRDDLQKEAGLRVAGIRDLFDPILVDNLWGLDGGGRTAVSL